MTSLESVPLLLALVAGALATLNPCGFPLLPAFLSFYVGTDEAQLPRAASRIGQGLLVGLLATGGFLGLFAVVGLPVSLGATVVARSVPWAGIMLGVVLVGVGLSGAAGHQIRLPGTKPLPVGHQRSAATVVLFGMSYGIASLGCTLPVFLTLVGSSVGTGTAGSVVAFAAYGTGMAVMLMALSVAAALAQHGLARHLRRLLPLIPRLSGGLLMVAGAYLAYYWWRIRFGPRATLASDPLVGRVGRYTARLNGWAEGAGWQLVVIAALVVLLAAGCALRLRRKPGTARPIQPTTPRGAPDAH